MIKRISALLTLVMLFVFSATALLAQEGGATAATTEVEASNSTGMIVGVWHLHSAVRWLVVVITVALLVKLVIGLVTGGAFDGLARGLTRAFSIATGVQWLIGIVLFLVFGSFDIRYRWEHAIVMTVAVALAGMTSRWKDAPDSKRYQMTLLIVVIVLALVYVGVALLPQGWRAMPTT
jgi:hypothetical protein